MEVPSKRVLLRWLQVFHCRFISSQDSTLQKLLTGRMQHGPRLEEGGSKMNSANVNDGEMISPGYFELGKWKYLLVHRGLVDGRML